MEVEEVTTMTDRELAVLTYQATTMNLAVNTQILGLTERMLSLTSQILQSRLNENLYLQEIRDILKEEKL